MATLVNLTGTIADLVGGAYSDGYAKVWIETNVQGDVIIDATGNQLRLGDAKATLNGSGAFTFTGLWATNSASNPTSFQYRVFVEYATRRPGGQRKPVRWCSGWFSLTATSDLADVTEEQYAPPSWQTTFTTAMQTYADGAAASATAAANSEAAAEAARDAAIDISNISTSDGVVEALIKNTAGAGPLTSAAVELMAGAATPIDPRRPEYGAAWDGVTDDTLAIRAAVTDAIATGRPVLIPRGTGLVGTVDTNGYIIPVLGGVSFVGEGHGSIVKVKAGTGDYVAVFGPSGAPSTNMSGLSFDNFTIDQNNANNAATYTGLITNGKIRAAILGYTGAASDFRVNRMRFKNFDSVNTVVVNGASAESVFITNNLFEMGSNTAAAHDHSTIYVSATGMTITGNQLVGVSGGLGSTTAIETHGSGQVVTGNRVKDYYTGANITGVVASGTDGAVVADNVFRNVNIGIDLWSRTPGTGLRIAHVHHNLIDLNRDVWVGRTTTDFTRGIMLDPTSTADIEHLKINDNTIVYRSFATAAQTGELQAAGIALWNNSTGVFNNLEVLNNLVVGSLSSGVRLQATVNRGRIANNTIVNPGSSTEAALASFYKSGITLVGTLTDVVVENNRTFDTRGTHLIAQGINTSLTAVTRCTQGNNTVTCTDGTTLTAFVQTAGKLFTVRADVPVGSRFTSALYYGPNGNRSAVAQVNQQMTTVPFWVSNTTSFDRIGAQVTVAGAAATVVRLGIYADDGSGMPGSLILDAGTIAGDAVASAEVTISTTLSPGLYWLAAVPQGGTPTMVCASGTNIQGGAGVSTLAVATGTNPRFGYLQASVSGALPATFASTGQSAAPVVVALRAV